MTGRRRDAVEAAARAAARLLREPPSQDLLRALELHGEALIVDGRYGEARDVLVNACRVADELPGRGGSRLSAILCLLGQAHHNLGDDNAAESLHRDAIAWADRHDGAASRQAAVARFELGGFLIDADRPLESVEALEQAIAIVERWPEQTAERTLYWPSIAVFLARAHLCAGRPAAALMHVDSASLLAERAPQLPSFAIYWFLERADILLKLERPDEAASALASARALAKAHDATTAIERRIEITQVQLDIELGRLDAADTGWRQLQSCNDLAPLQQCSVWELRGEIDAARGQHEAAARAFEEARANLDRIGPRLLAARARLDTGRGRALLKLARFEEAEACLRSALSIIEQVQDTQSSVDLPFIRGTLDDLHRAAGPG